VEYPVAQQRLLEPCHLAEVVLRVVAEPERVELRHSRPPLALDPAVVAGCADWVAEGAQQPTIGPWLAVPDAQPVRLEMPRFAPAHGVDEVGHGSPPAVRGYHSDDTCTGGGEQPGRGIRSYRRLA